MYSPTLETFLKLAKQGNVVPVTRKLLADFETPLSAYHKIRGQGESFLFESVVGGEHLGRYSFVGCNPRAVIRQVGNAIQLIENGKVIERFVVSHEPASPPDTKAFVMGQPTLKKFGQVEEVTMSYAPTETPPQTVRDGLEVVERVMKKYRPVSLPSLPRFTGGAVGFIGYEFIHDVEPIVPRPAQDDLKTPVMYFLIADELLIFDRVAQTITVLVNAILEDGVNPADAYEDAVGEIERLMSLLEQPSQYKPVTVPSELPSLPFQSNVTREKFLSNVLKAKEYITSGDIIQVVGSQRFSTPVKASPLDIYRAARSINPSPYMFLLELEGMSLVGASPELHVRCEDHQVEIRPIAGTRPRGQTPEQDCANEKELLADPKERAEHVMLVDLARNDLGRVCNYGSVQVKDLMVIERYSHVMHIVSQVEGQLSPEKTPYDLMRATFPAGTLSGAPKVRAMQIIAELEQTQRGTYGGCVGYFSFNGNLDCCITIRTALIKDGKAYVQAGGGWVNDSTPEAEFDETVNKAKAMLKAVAVAESFTAGN
ncbi:MAG TPA: anthranilate synthase component I [Verrucomicrobiae bacterium]|jgi:anthranilate synthase component 1|nr:anthranilate synthase component I [Verrucomicrobiae bacterium]